MNYFQQQKSIVREIVNGRHSLFARTIYKNSNTTHELWRSILNGWPFDVNWWQAGLGALLITKRLNLTKFTLSKMPKPTFVLTMIFYLDIHVCKRSSAKHSTIFYSFKSLQTQSNNRTFWSNQAL